MTLMDVLTPLQMHHACIIYPFSLFMTDYYSVIIFVHCQLQFMPPDRVKIRQMSMQNQSVISHFH